MIERLCCICGKVLDSEWIGGEGQYAHIECGKSRVTYQKKICTNCGHVRRVKCHFYPMIKRESFAEICTACQFEDAARAHERAAAKQRAQAQEIRRRRSQRKK